MRGDRMIAGLKDAGVAFVVALPDITTSDALLWPISRDPALNLVRICKEDEGVAICTGLAFSGRRSVLLMQQTGLLDSINAIRAVAIEYDQPVVMIVGLQGKEPDVAPDASSKFAVRIVTPILDAMGMEHRWLEHEGDEDAIAPAIEAAYARSRPVCLLVGRPPVTP
jgi:sulfopyruvate decarboxylase subunit alpha